LVVTFGGQLVITGATLRVVMVGSLMSAVLGSSELRVTPAAVSVAWLLTAKVFAGNGVLIVASKVMVILSPGRSVPMLTQVCLEIIRVEVTKVALATPSFKFSNDQPL